jgi:hypothetical protein
LPSALSPPEPEFGIETCSKVYVSTDDLALFVTTAGRIVRVQVQKELSSCPRHWEYADAVKNYLFNVVLDPMDKVLAGFRGVFIGTDFPLNQTEARSKTLRGIVHTSASALPPLESIVPPDPARAIFDATRRVLIEGGAVTERGFGFVSDMLHEEISRHIKGLEAVADARVAATEVRLAKESQHTQPAFKPQVQSEMFAALPGPGQTSLLKALELMTQIRCQRASSGDDSGTEFGGSVIALPTTPAPSFGSGAKRPRTTVFSPELLPGHDVSDLAQLAVFGGSA